MIEKVTPLTPTEAYRNLRQILLREQCKITHESRRKIEVEQGSWDTGRRLSLWGAESYTPDSYPKRITFTLASEKGGTKIVSSTHWQIGQIIGLLGAASISLCAFIWWGIAITNILYGWIIASVASLLIIACFGSILIRHIQIYTEKDRVARAILNHLPDTT